MTDIEFDNGAAQKVLVHEYVWPTGRDWHGQASVDAARAWWIDLLDSVTVGINGVDWREEQCEQGGQESIVREAVEGHVATARKERRVLALCDLSELDKVLDDPREGGVYARLASRFLGEGAGVRVRRHAGEDPQEYEERRARIEQEYEDDSVQMLQLGSLAATYLASAAEAVAERWAADQFAAWVEANPEPDEEEEEE